MMDNGGGQDSFHAATQDMTENLKRGGLPKLTGPTGKAVLRFTLAALAARRIPGAGLVELPTDHHPGDEAPEALLEALREFLDRLSPT